MHICRIPNGKTLSHQRLFIIICLFVCLIDTIVRTKGDHVVIFEWIVKNNNLTHVSTGHTLQPVHLQLPSQTHCQRAIDVQRLRSGEAWWTCDQHQLRLRTCAWSFFSGHSNEVPWCYVGGITAQKIWNESVCFGSYLNAAILVGWVVEMKKVCLHFNSEANSCHHPKAIVEQNVTHVIHISGSLEFVKVHDNRQSHVCVKIGWNDLQCRNLFKVVRETWSIGYNPKRQWAVDISTCRGYQSDCLHILSGPVCWWIFYKKAWLLLCCIWCHIQNSATVCMIFFIQENRQNNKYQLKTISN